MSADAPNDHDNIRRTVGTALDLPMESIGPDDDLITLGLDSIRMMALAGRWRRAGHTVDFATLAAEPTVAAWARLLSSGVGTAESEQTPDAGITTPIEAGPVPPIDALVADTVPQITTSDASEPFPLAPMQHAYWVGRSGEQELGGVAAHLYVEFDAPRRLDPERLRCAVAELVAGHPMLRTSFRPDGTQQQLSAPGRSVFCWRDLSDRTSEQVEAELDAARQLRSHQRLDVAAGQVLDVSLTLLPDGRSRLHLDVDMLAADAMSYRILVHELAKHYAGEVVTPPRFTFRQYREQVVEDAQARDRDREWWQHRLDELPGAPELPMATTTERPDTEHTVRHHFWLESATADRLRSAAHRHGVTPAMALAAVFADTIGGWSAQPRFLLNLPLFHREPVHPEVDRVVGDFTSSVLLDVDVTEDVSVADRARALQQTLHRNAAHASHSGLDVLRDLGRRRGEPVLAPIVYTSALNLGELFAGVVGDVFGEPVWIVSQGPQVLLDAQVTELRGGLLLNWDVRAAAFPEGMIEGMFARYTQAVQRLADGDAGWAAAAAARLPLSQATIRASVNDTAGEVTGRLLHQGLFDHAATTPDAPAVRWTSPAGEVDGWSYRQLAEEALTIAGALHAAGVRPGDTVAVQLSKGPRQILAVSGILAAGAAYLPIGVDQPAARRSAVLADAAATVLITAERQQIPGVRALPLHELRAHLEPLTEPALGDPEAPAYLLFTSGSTGRPKGVEVPHRAAMAVLDALNDRFEITAADRSLAISALEFDLSVYDIFGLLSAGGTVVTLDADQRSEPTAWAQVVAAHRVTVLNCVPAILDMLLDTAALDSLRVVLLGGDWVSAELARRLRRQVPGCRFAGLGGATETAIHSTVCEVDHPPAQWATVPWGVPLRNVRCRVVSPTGRDCPDWVSGELWVGGANVALGYRNDPERTAQRFVKHDGVRWYRTGDLARYRPDGTLEFLGRADHQVQVRGYRIELGEVEAALRKAPGVRHAVVIGDGTRLVAAVAGTEVDAAATAEAARNLLPAYMIPDRIEVLARMPLSSNGKLDRATVNGLLERTGDAAPGRPPTDAFESAVAVIVAEVLGLAQVGVDDDFFRLGGDSVQATAVIARVRDWLTVDHATVGDFFTTRTVAALTARLAARDSRPRLIAVAQLYSEVTSLSDAELLEQTS